MFMCRRGPHRIWLCISAGWADMALVGMRSAASAAIGDEDTGVKRDWKRADVVGLLEKTGEGCMVDGRRPGREEKDLCGYG